MFETTKDRSTIEKHQSKHLQHPNKTSRSHRDIPISMVHQANLRRDQGPAPGNTTRSRQRNSGRKQQ